MRLPWADDGRPTRGAPRTGRPRDARPARPVPGDLDLEGLGIDRLPGQHPTYLSRSMSPALKTASKTATNLLSRSRSRNRSASIRSPRFTARLRLLDDPGTGRV